MPTSLVKKVARDTGRSIDDVESMWATAKKQASQKDGIEQDTPAYWKYTTGVFKNIVKNATEERSVRHGSVAVSIMNETRSVEITGKERRQNMPTVAGALLETYNALAVEETDRADAGGPEVVEARREKVVRGGKVMIKTVCPPGFKAKSGKCVKMTSAERKTRAIAGKRAARKNKGKRAQIARKRAKSLKKAQNL